ncbi:hypothetical protein SDC9_144773 [bioreactor metagenome]|uniref:Uncharacterized protein n=1 Tax=bioreactor metagenome TaxID=1076179 RepID=A0A645E8Q1_9ZZZZ
MVTIVQEGIVPLFPYNILPMYTTPSGWLLNHCVSPKTPTPSSTNVLGKLIDARAVQPENALLSIAVTELGITTEFIALQP